MRDLLVKHRQLLSQCDDRGVDRVVFHVLLNLAQRKAHRLHNEDRIEIIDLLCRVIPVFVARIDVGRLKQADLVVKDQRLLGDILISGKLADGKHIFHEKPLDTIVTISFII